MTIGDVRGWAIARLGLTLEAFGLLRQGEFWEAMVAWSEDRVADRRHTAEIVRAVGLRLFNIQLAKGKAVTLHEFLPFPWDEEEKPDDGGLSEMTPEETRRGLTLLSPVCRDPAIGV